MGGGVVLVSELCLRVCVRIGTCGLVAMTSASHAEGRQFDPGQVYILLLMPRICVHWTSEIKLQIGEV